MGVITTIYVEKDQANEAWAWSQIRDYQTQYREFRNAMPLIEYRIWLVIRSFVKSSPKWRGKTQSGLNNEERYSTNLVSMFSLSGVEGSR
jgi:hypothetical protein